MADDKGECALKEEKISVFQATVLFTAIYCGTSIVINPAADAGTYAWLAYLIGWLGGYILFIITASIAALNPNKSLVNILISCFGNKAGKIIGLIYGLFFIRLSSGILQTYGYYEITANLPETPILFIAICYMLIIAFTVKIGLEAMARISEISFILIIFIIIFSLFSIITSFHLDFFMPVLKNGVKQPLIAGLKMTMLPFGEGIAALTIFPNINNGNKIFKVANFTILFSGIIILLIIFRNISVVGTDAAERIIFPAENIFRLFPGIDIYPLLHIDVILFCVMKTSVMLYASVKTIADVFSLKDFKIFVLPIAALNVILSMLIYNNIFNMLLLIRDVIPLFDIPFLFLMPVIILVISLIKLPNSKITKIKNQNIISD